MNPNKLKRLFPNASPDFITLNSSLPDAEPERDETPALGAAVPGEAESLRRVRVRFTGYRVRPLDPDNFAGSVKDLLDGLRHAQIIPGDEPERIVLETEQVRVSSFGEEKTVIEVELNELTLTMEKAESRDASAD